MSSPFKKLKETLSGVFFNLLSWLLEFLPMSMQLPTKPDASWERYCVSVKRPGGFNMFEFLPLDVGTVGCKCGIDVLNKGNIVRTPEDLLPDMVVVKVKCIGINYADVCIRWGFYSSANQFVGYPIIPGFEVSGTVEKIGKDVQKFSVGDEVICLTLFGGYSTHVCIPERYVSKRPQEMSPEIGSCFTAVGATAYYAAYNLADVKAGQTVLIHSAAGGVGSQLVQMCKLAGCRVIGVVGRTKKIPIAKNLGCDEVILKQELWKQTDLLKINGFDVIFDANGVSTLEEGFRRLNPMGRIVIYGFHSNLPHTGTINPLQWLKLAYNLYKTPQFDPFEMVTANKSVMGFNLSYLTENMHLYREINDVLIPMVAKKDVKIEYTAYHLKNVVQAHKDIQSGKTTGKLILCTDYYYECKKNENQKL